MTQQSSRSNSPKICIIGAGPCGITAAKNMIQQGLTNVTVFEKNNQLGGNWFFDENNAHSSVYETTHLISSKRLSEYEDFPMPADYPDYPSHGQLLNYFNDYAQHFGVNKFIRFNTTVTNITREASQQWRVVYQDATGMQEEYFDYLLVANGHHWDPLMPSYKGQFTGELLHSHYYKKSAPFKNKRVLVVGGGNSACDVAVEIARVSKKTCISMRSAQHIFPKFILGKATDVAFAKIKWMPSWFKQRVAAVIIRVLQGRYDKYKLKKPSDRPLEVHPTINSELLYFIRHGKIFPREGIERFDGNDVYFVDGSHETFDVVMFATGYKISFPFFSKDILDSSDLKNLRFYRKMIYPKFDNLFFIGLFQPQGCIWPLADYQSKIAATIIKGTLKRPDNLIKKIEKEVKTSGKCYKETTRHALEVDYHAFRKQLLNELKKEKNIC